MYKTLNKQLYKSGDYTITPIRSEDRLDIMKWRNEQIYHLRQNKPLTETDQDNYFKNVIQIQFNQNLPDQILFSFLKNDVCIGYGGLVHINWTDKNAEISFIMNTNLEKNRFHEIWTAYLTLIEKVAFDELQLHKVFVYAFDLRPHLYETLEENNFMREAELKEHCYYNNQFINVVIHSKFSNK